MYLSNTSANLLCSPYNSTALAITKEPQQTTIPSEKYFAHTSSPLSTPERNFYPKSKVSFYLKQVLSNIEVENGIHYQYNVSNAVNIPSNGKNTIGRSPVTPILTAPFNHQVTMKEHRPLMGTIMKNYVSLAIKESNFMTANRRKFFRTNTQQISG